MEPDTTMDAITREELYRLVWSRPMTKVAEQFGVSGSYMARVCSVLQVPRPERGYWVKLAAGKASPPAPLPEALPGDQLVWSKNSGLDALPERKPVTRRKPRARKTNQSITSTHALIRGAKTHFESGRPADDLDYLKPYKKLLVDVTASKAGLDKALAFANDLFNALESAGHRVALAPRGEHFQRGEVEEREQPIKRQGYHYSRLWSPYRPTVVYLGTVVVGLAVIEMSETVKMRYVNGKYIRVADYVPPKASRHYVDRTWTTTKELPCGRLRVIAYSPYWRVPWSVHWQETKNAPLTPQLPAIVKTIEDSVPGLVEKLKEAAHQAAIERQKWQAEEERRRQEEDRRQIQKSIKDSQAQLLGIIQAWSNAMNVERFFKEAEDRAVLLPADERDPVYERLRLAREFLGTQHPLDFLLAWKTPLERYRPTPTGAMDVAAKGESIDHGQK